LENLGKVENFEMIVDFMMENEKEITRELLKKLEDKGQEVKEISKNFKLI